MQNIWLRIEHWLKENAPPVFDSLALGAREEQLVEVESVLDVKLTDDLRQSYLIHDGQINDMSPLMDDWSLLSLDNALSEWRLMKKLYQAGELEAEAEPSEEIISTWWSLKWFPIASNGSGDFYCIDFEPSEKGKVGQVIEFLHTDPTREKKADSFRLWLSDYVMMLESGMYRFKNGVMRQKRQN